MSKFWRQKLTRRQFTKLVGLSYLGMAAGNLTSIKAMSLPGQKKKKFKQWVWIDSDINASSDDWKRSFEAIHAAGIDAILPMIYDSRQAYYASKHLPIGEPLLETIIPIARQAGLEVHAWMMTMPCNIESIVENHPEWFVVNRLGQSSTVKPAYVDYYKFLCPSRPEVWEFLRETVSELSSISGLDGVHLDYIRYPDVILPVGLQPRYHIVQDKEYPQYDYCYCDVCRHDFKAETGTDPRDIRDPASDQEWNRFRYDRITHIVNDVLRPIVHKNKKALTAAVFPNWKDVRQQWSHWKLDGAMPMLYAGYYDGGVDWIGKQTREGSDSQLYHARVYSGLSVGQLSPEDLSKAVDVCYKSGASGVSLFNLQSMNDAKWKSFKEAVTAGE